MSTWNLSLVSLICGVAASACAPAVEEEQGADPNVSLVVSELTGDCQVTAACPGGLQLSCTGSNYQCSSFGGGDPFAHYLEIAGGSRVFGHGESASFKVTNNSGASGIQCNGVSQTCPYYSGTAVIYSSDTSATAGTWPRTVTMGESFSVSFTNRTYSSKYPALYIGSVSFGTAVSPTSIGLTVVGRDGSGHQN